MVSMNKQHNNLINKCFIGEIVQFIDIIIKIWPKT